MSKDIVQRLRALPPEMADPGDRFDRVRARAVRRRRRLAIATAAAVTVVAAVGVPLGLALAGGFDRPPGPAQEPANVLSCPRTFDGPPRWVPQPPAGVDGRSQLVPRQPPQRALVCAFAGSTPRSSIGAVRPAPSGGRVLSSGLDQLADDLSWLPRNLDGGQSFCRREGGRPTYYLIGLTYPDGTVWVSTDDSDCAGASNGEFTSQRSIGSQAAASWVAGAWVPDPWSPHLDDRDPCLTEPPGRLGQETAIVPPDPVSVKVCKRTDSRTGDSFDTRTATDGYRDLVHALNALRTRPSTSGCDGEPLGRVSYELAFQYATGPPVLVRVLTGGCVPTIDNGSLQAWDAGNVLPKITRILGAGS